MNKREKGSEVVVAKNKYLYMNMEKGHYKFCPLSGNQMGCLAVKKMC